MNAQSNTVSDIEQVRRAKALYCRFVDTKEWARFSDLLEPAVHVQAYDPAGGTIAAFDDRGSYVDAVSAFLHGAQSIHQVHNDEIDQLSDTEISGIWSMEDVIVFPKNSDGRPARLHGYGHYHELWRRGPDGWRLARMELRRTILDIVDA